MPQVETEYDPFDHSYVISGNTYSGKSGMEQVVNHICKEKLSLKSLGLLILLLSMPNKSKILLSDLGSMFKGTSKGLHKSISELCDSGYLGIYEKVDAQGLPFFEFVLCPHGSYNQIFGVQKQIEQAIKERQSAFKQYKGNF